MRGSTAGLADTLAGGTRAQAALLEAADALFASLLVAPAVVAYWKSTWTLMDLYVFPDEDEAVKSALYCAVYGTLVGFLFCVFQVPISNLVRPEKSKVGFLCYSRFYSCVASVACVASWRGLWNLLNEGTSDSALTLLAITGTATVALAMLRSLRNLCAVPFAVAVDTPMDYFDVPTMLRTNMRDRVFYVLDSLISVVIVGSLVVVVWRGCWTALDIYLFPDDQAKSCWTSMITGYILAIIAFGSQSSMRWAVARLHGFQRLLLTDVYHFLSFLSTVNVWRGIWGILDVYLYPDHPKISNLACHVLSMLLLIVLKCSNSILVRGVYIDGEEPAGECVVFPCHYLRLLFHKEKTKKRHKMAIAAAVAASKVTETKSDPTLVPLQPPVVRIEC